MLARRNKYLLSIIIVFMYLFGYNGKQLCITATNDYVPIFNNENTNSNLSLSPMVMIVSESKGAEPLSAASATLTSGLANIYNKKIVKNEQNVPLVTAATAKHEKLMTEPSTLIELNQNLENKLKSIRNKELGVPFIQEIFDSMEFIPFDRNDTAIVEGMAAKLTAKLNKAIRHIGHLNFIVKTELEKISEKFKQRQHAFLHSVVYPCPYDEKSLAQHYDRKQIEIKNYLKTAEQFVDQTNINFTINNELMESMKLINYSLLNFRQIFFLSKDDYASDYNCHLHTDNNHLRYVFAATIKHKRLLILIDHGSSLSDQLELTKNFAISTINMLNEMDEVAIIAISDKPSTFLLYEDQQQQPSMADLKLYKASMDNKLQFIRFIENLNATKDITNHSLAFQYSFERLKEILDKTEIDVDTAVPMLMLYISRGLLSPLLTEAKNVLEAIANGQQQLEFPVIINTCAIILDEKRVMYEKQFLNDIAQQNYTKYQLDTSSWLTDLSYNITGKMFVINKRYPNEMYKTSAAIFGHWWTDRKYLETKMMAHLPIFIESNENDMIIPITQLCETNGIFGIDMYLSDISEDVIYYNKYQDSYAFLIDTNGYAIMHPSYPRPMGIKTNPFTTDIRYLEQLQGFESVRTKMLTLINGIEVIETATSEEGVKNTHTYTWHRATNFYVICIVTIRHNETKSPVHLRRVNVEYYQQNDIIAMSGNFVPELIYHRIDLIPMNSLLCKHFRQLATMDSITLFLSASSFVSPYDYLKSCRDGTTEEKTQQARHIMAYIKDQTTVLSNPGLLPQIRNDVTALFHVMSYLKKRHIESDAYKNYVIRRYATTMNGVVLMYPGTLLNFEIEPIRRPWFVKAMQHPGKIVLTEPYLDAGGAGYVVTIAHTLYEGKANALHNADRDIPVAIVAVDITLGFLYKLLLDSASYCSATNVKCFLMEDRGFLVSHPSILEPLTLNSKNSRRPLEHITHKESYMANDILYHRQLVEKRLCINYINRTNQRYYLFNTSLTSVLTNRAHGERTKYQITAVPGTNVFVALLNATCDGGAFCPCSTVDRICLNCNRMEQTNCECPCECPLQSSAFSKVSSLLNVTCASTDMECHREENPTELCEPLPEQFAAFNVFSSDVEADLKSCTNINCEQYGTQNECLGVMGCGWCQVDVDGETYFTSPFCTHQQSCFNGVLGSITPYGDGDLGSQLVDSIPPAYSAIGPIAGAVIALCLVIGFAMYCYRQNLDSASEQLYHNSVQENNFGMPLSRFDYDDINPHDDGDLGGNSMNRNLLRPLQQVAIPDISPYRINAGIYRATPAHAESDHGYSTMTPREDSEHLCFALAEPLIHNNKRISMSDSASLNTSVSSPTNQNYFIQIDRPKVPYNTCTQQSPPGKDGSVSSPPTTTILPPMSPHHIQAQVTVHHPMEAV